MDALPPGPKVVLSSMPTLDFGAARELFVAAAADFMAAYNLVKPRAAKAAATEENTGNTAGRDACRASPANWRDRRVPRASAADA